MQNHTTCLSRWTLSEDAWIEIAKIFHLTQHFVFAPLLLELLIRSWTLTGLLDLDKGLVWALNNVRKTSSAGGQYGSPVLGQTSLFSLPFSLVNSLPAHAHSPGTSSRRTGYSYVVDLRCNYFINEGSLGLQKITRLMSWCHRFNCQKKMPAHIRK